MNPNLYRLAIESVELARFVSNKQIEKHDALIGDALLEREYAAKMLDIPGARSLLDRIDPAIR